MYTSVVRLENQPDPPDGRAPRGARRFLGDLEARGLTDRVLVLATSVIERQYSGRARRKVGVRLDAELGRARLPSRGMVVWQTTSAHSAAPDLARSPVLGNDLRSPCLPAAGNDWLTVQEAADLLGLQFRTVYALVDRGELPDSLSLLSLGPWVAAGWYAASAVTSS